MNWLSKLFGTEKTGPEPKATFNLKDVMQGDLSQESEPQASVQDTAQAIHDRMRELVGIVPDLIDEIQYGKQDQDQGIQESAPVKTKAGDLLSNIANQLSEGFLGNDQCGQRSRECAENMSRGVAVIQKKIQVPGAAPVESTQVMPIEDDSSISETAFDLMQQSRELLHSLIEDTTGETEGCQECQEEVAAPDGKFFGVDNVVSAAPSIEGSSEMSILATDLNVAQHMIKAAINGSTINTDSLLTLLDPTKFSEIDEDIADAVADAYVKISADTKKVSMQKLSYLVQDDRRDKQGEFYKDIDSEQNPQRIPIPYNYQIWLEKVGDTHQKAMGRLQEQRNPINQVMKLNVPDGKRSNPVREVLKSLEARLREGNLNDTKQDRSDNYETRLDADTRRPWDGKDDENVESVLSGKEHVGEKKDTLYGISIEKRMDGKHQEASDDSIEKRFKEIHTTTDIDEDEVITKSIEIILEEWRKEHEPKKQEKTAGFGGGIAVEAPAPTNGVIEEDPIEETNSIDDLNRLSELLSELQDLGASVDIHVDTQGLEREYHRKINESKPRTHKTLEEALGSEPTLTPRFREYTTPVGEELEEENYGEEFTPPAPEGINAINDGSSVPVGSTVLNANPDIHMGTQRAKYQGGPDQYPTPQDEY